MRVMVLAKATEGMSLGEPTPEALEAFAAMDRFTEELVKAGVFVAAAGLKNDSQSKRIVSDGASRSVIDGPFAESRELIAGFSIWEVRDMDEAVAWAPFLRPAAATNTPALTSSSVKRSIAANASSASGVGSPSSMPSVAFANTITRIVCLLV